MEKRRFAHMLVDQHPLARGHGHVGPVLGWLARQQRKFLWVGHARRRLADEATGIGPGARAMVFMISAPAARTSAATVAISPSLMPGSTMVLTFPRMGVCASRDIASRCRARSNSAPCTPR